MLIVFFVYFFILYILDDLGDPTVNIVLWALDEEVPGWITGTTNMRKKIIN